MRKYMVISGSGPDRVGLVDDISNFLSQKNLNLEDSRMAVLGGEFALILLVSGQEKDIEWLRKNLSKLSSKTGLSLQARLTRAPKERHLQKTVPFKMVLSGMDHPGVVHKFTSIIHKFGTNIESMETRVSQAPLSGTPIFTMECTLAVPASVKLKELKSELGFIAEEENLDLIIEQVETK